MSRLSDCVWGDAMGRRHRPCRLQEGDTPPIAIHQTRRRHRVCRIQEGGIPPVAI
ncbi:hypothetical protein Taro_003943 [Colocasia esculenta]|uniref:Uncharacterized protein n=1 Tax=Colocasia esculenta TaxID=4460 RepID=A0A843TKS7_COLES|nr:hypothetical protein [Colocasia esculenta]